MATSGLGIDWLKRERGRCGTSESTGENPALDGALEGEWRARSGQASRPTAEKQAVR